MAAVTVCTGFGPAGYAQYGVAALQSFDRYWPPVDLVAYTEAPIAMPRGVCRNLWDIPGAREFFERHKDNLRVQGRDGPKYAWRRDALKWFRQCLIPHHASASLADGDILVWLDGDVISFRTVPDGLIERLLGPAEITYLGRLRRLRDPDPDRIGRDGSEIGFWAVRLSPATRQFLAEFADAYLSDRVFDLAEWHSAYVFDVTRRRLVRTGELVERNLTPHGHGHVWFQSELGRYLDHLKGNRKELGRSPERSRIARR